MHREYEVELDPWQIELLKANPDLADNCLWPDERDVLFYAFDALDFFGDPELVDLRGDLADFLAQFKVREAQAQAFLNQHPPAPRRWRTLSKQNKSF